MIPLERHLFGDFNLIEAQIALCVENRSFGTNHLSVIPKKSARLPHGWVVTRYHLLYISIDPLGTQLSSHRFCLCEGRFSS